MQLHCATKVMHWKVWCEKYKLYMFVFKKIYDVILWSIHAFVTKSLWTGTQQIHSNGLSNIRNQKSYLTFWQQDIADK